MEISFATPTSIRYFCVWRFTGGIRSECGHVSHNGTWGALAGAEGFRAGNRWHGTPDSNSDQQAHARRRAWEPITSSSPPDDAFRRPPEFAATALHELGHWTGHRTKLNREEGMKAKFGSVAYAMEELRAELSSAFLAGDRKSVV